VDTLPTEREALAWLLSEDLDLSIEEPQIAAAINEQLSHMELKSHDLESIRRIRDVAIRHNPKTIIEVGGGIGHLSAWLLDAFSPKSESVEYTIVESGNKFAAILLRLTQRFNASEWTQISAMRFQELAGECKAWLISNKALLNSSSIEAMNPPAAIPADLIIIDVGDEEQVECIQEGLSLLSNNGLLLTIEPNVPYEGASEEEANRFQSWMDLIRDTQEKYRLGFVPLKSTTLVAFMTK
jgi:predicted O-methyltransferase YrrM